MKTFISIILLSIIFFTFSCTKIENLLNPTLESDKIILEITSDFQGSWWMSGKVLDFRLFENGTIEYDEYPLQSPNKTLQAKNVIVTKQRKLSESEVEQIKNLLESGDFIKLEDKISQDKSCVDAFRNTELTVESNKATKKISISNCANLSDTKSTSFYFKDFPLTLNKLFYSLKEIKNEDSKGKFYD